MRKFVCFLSILISIAPLTNLAQNLITNGDFEDYNQLPGGFDEMERCNSWNNDGHKFDNNGNPFYAHSPDYQRTDAWHPSGQSLLPYSPNGYVGMYNYELIDQGINLTEGNLYVLSFYVKLKEEAYDYSPTPWNNSSLRVLLGKKEMYYDYSKYINGQAVTSHSVHSDNGVGNDPNCSNPTAYSHIENGVVVGSGSQDIQEIYKVNLNLNDYPSSSWHKITKIFRAPKDAAINITGYYDWIGFELVSNNTSSCYDGYLLMDNISVIPLCDDFCVNPDHSPPTYGYMDGGSLVSGFKPNPWPVEYNQNGDYHNFQMYIANATYIYFDVRSNWSSGQIVFSEEYLDPVKIHDPGWSDFQFNWDGETNDGSTLPFYDYPYDIIIKNCYGGINFTTGTLQYSPPDGGWQHFPLYYSELIPECCQDHIVYDNINFSSDDRQDMNDYIEAGVNGSVTASNGVNITWHAGNDIKLGSYFTSNPNAEYDMVITPCGINRVANPNSGTEPRGFDYPTISTQEVKKLTFDVILSPQPVSTELKFITIKDISNIQIYSISNQLLLTSINTKNVNVSSLASGTYFTRITSTDGETVNKKFIKE